MTLTVTDPRLLRLAAKPGHRVTVTTANGVVTAALTVHRPCPITPPSWDEISTLRGSGSDEKAAATALLAERRRNPALCF